MQQELRSIIIESDFSPAGELIAQMRQAVPETEALFKIEKQEASFRLEPTVLVALIGVAGTVLGALIQGLLARTNARRKAKVRIERADGTAIELPGDSTPDQIREALRSVSVQTVYRIRLLEA
jgi:hypothetical protein